MKKSLLILLVLTFTLLTACSGSDDAAPPIETTSLYGTWNLDYYIQNGNSVENIECSNQITYVFTNTKTYTKTTYAGEGATNCAVAVIVNGKWENLGDGQIRLTPNGSTVDQNLALIFTDNFKKFSLSYSNNYKEVYAKTN